MDAAQKKAFDQRVAVLAGSFGQRSEERDRRPVVKDELQQSVVVRPRLTAATPNIRGGRSHEPFAHERGWNSRGLPGRDRGAGGAPPAVAAAPAGLAAFAPQGGLLAIESPDFAALVKAWMTSPEEQRWLASDNYAGFSRSRLFGQLGDAQGQFVATAGLPVDSDFVQQIAGRESILVLYDIRTLDFLYITHMAAGGAEKTPLLALRSKFEERKVGDTSFYVRTEGDPARTVAFAVRGDYLLLATNSDRMAAALELMQQPSDRTLKSESWYANTVAAAARQPGDLRMTLNLTQIVASPYFRSYWVQQNVTQMKQYTAGLSDLYRDARVFREERVLLKSDPEQKYVSADLAPVLVYVPAKSGVYRATAQPDAATVLAQLQNNALDRAPPAFRDAHQAPAADLSTPQAGDAASLEERIDEPVVLSPARTVQLKPLSDLLNAMPAQAMLVYSATETPASGLTTVHAAVALAGEPGRGMRRVCKRRSVQRWRRRSAWAPQA